MYQHVDTYPGDPILTLNESFAKDPRPGKINLSIGVYLNDDRQLPRMQAVADAEEQLRTHAAPHPYLPMEGASEYRTQVKHLVFGAQASLLQRIATVQTLGGSGALKIGGDFLKAWFPQARVWVSDPTWDNHRGIFEGSGFNVRQYPYYSSETGDVDFDAMLGALQDMPSGDVVVLHACCHNPTGAELSEAQWRELATLCRERRLIAFFDMAYQGFGRGIEEDAFAVRQFAAQDIPMLVASSFSKNFALYGERCGALQVVCPDPGQAETVLSQLKSIARRIYSSPPAHGSKIITAVLKDPVLQARWRGELDAMRARINSMRRELHAQLVSRCPGKDIDYLNRQAGMFSYTGLSASQVRRLKDEFGVYLIESGRICIAALTPSDVDQVAEAFARLLE
jgi:aromatic-amino-acid transaminase